MDKTFRRWTIGAVIAAIICGYSLWWAGSTNGAYDLCNLLGIQTTPYCVHNSDAHIWWLLAAVASLIYLGFYVARVRKLLKRQDRSAQQPEDTEQRTPSR